MTQRRIVLPMDGEWFHVLTEYSLQRNEAVALCGDQFTPQVMLDVNVSDRALCPNCQALLAVSAYVTKWLE